MIKHRNKPVLACKEPGMQENGSNKFRTIVSEVLSFVGNPVYIDMLAIAGPNWMTFFEGTQGYPGIR